MNSVNKRPLPELTIIVRIKNELGKNPSLLFAEFDENPIASASLAQVHLARLHDGRQVAVKVQYPGIEEIVKKDLETVKTLLSFLSIFLRIKGLGNIHSQFSNMINEELDFRLEANNIETISANFKENTNVIFPNIIHELSSERVLTTEYMEGVNISDLDKLSEFNVDRQRLAECLIKTYCQMIFSDGIYHTYTVFYPNNSILRFLKLKIQNKL